MGSKEYKKIDSVVSQIERFGHSGIGLSWCADRTAWAYKWKKITKQEMTDLTDRITKLFDEGYEIYG